MAQEKIQIVREAETQAALRIKEAGLKKESILENAKKEFEKIIKENQLQTSEKVEKIINETEAINKSNIEAAMKRAETEIVRMAEVVAKKKIEATKLILEEIV